MIHDPESLLIVAALDNTLNPSGKVGHILETDGLRQAREDSLFNAAIKTLLGCIHDEEVTHLRNCVGD